jgi:hypothetical protein
MQINESGLKTFPSGVAIARYLRVRLVSGVLQLAGASDAATELGVTETVSLAANEPQTVRTRSANGTKIGIASAAIVAGAAIQPAASGQIAPFSAGTQIGIALTAAAAAGDQFEFMYV